MRLARDLGIWSPRTPPVSSVQTALEQNSLMRFVRLAVKAVAALPLVAFIFSLVAPEVTHGIAAAVPPPALTAQEIAKIKQRAAAGDAWAEQQLGDWSYNGEHGLRRSLSTAAEWYRKAATQDNVGAQRKLAEMYEFGQGVPKNHGVALTWIHAATKQRPASAIGIAMDYQAGLGAPQDLRKAIEWFLVSAEAGYVIAQFTLGEIYESGMGVQNPVEAARWYQAAAQQNWGPAYSALAHLYETGKGVPQDYARAATLYRKATASDGFSGQYGLARLYDQGLGVPRDANKAMELYHEVLGIDEATQRLLELYEAGMNVPRDPTAAIAWYRAAAERGDLRAQEGLGLRYQLGEGLPKNCGVAYALYNLVARSPASARKAIPDFTGPPLLAEHCMLPATWKLVDAMAQPGNILRAIDEYIQHPPAIPFSD
jgi:TPR repeat protein